MLQLRHDEDIADVDDTGGREVLRQRRPRGEPGFPQRLWPEIGATPKASAGVGWDPQDDDPRRRERGQIGEKCLLHLLVASDAVDVPLKRPLGLGARRYQVQAATSRSKPSRQRIHTTCIHTDVVVRLAQTS